MSEIKNFDTLSVARLTSDNDENEPFVPFKFLIPSFQRGYRWEEKQIKELLDDLLRFVKTEDKSYFLQPIVVRKCKEQNTWEVLDGQQRLTTLYLILKRLMKYNPYDETSELYTIEYIERTTPDFNNLMPQNGLDSFYLKRAEMAIDKWVTACAKSYKSALQELVASLFYLDHKKLVKFIWYVVQETSEGDGVNDLNAIKVFNRLNKGKISLTSSELIKALYTIKYENRDKGEDPNNRINNSVDIFCEEWNTFERKFQDNDFWYFISNKQEEVQTRIDLLFDFVSRIDNNADDYDSMDSYRTFQEAFDADDADYKTDELWRNVKRKFDSLVNWYEDIELRNLIGYLIYIGKTPVEIDKIITSSKAEWEKSGKEWDDELTKKVLIGMISESINHCVDIETWEYKPDYHLIKKALLLYNIEYCNKYHTPFQFYHFKREGWDLEHIDSQKDNNIQAKEDKVAWLECVNYIHTFDKNAGTLLETGQALLDDIIADRDGTKKRFDDFYLDVFKYYHPNRGQNEQDKHTIDNLVLLNCGINRGYKNAPFPYKRYCVITEDHKGVFIPICTKNLFLKYYSGTGQLPSQLDFIKWGDDDRKLYLKDIQSTLKQYTAK